VGEPRRSIQKRSGHFLEDFEPGQLYRHKGGKTLTEGLFTTFTEFTMTTNPLSKNARYARAYGYRGLVVPPGLTMLVAFSQTVEDISENARANLEYVDMRFGAPVYLGDTLEVETRILGVKASSSKPNLGVVHVQSLARKNLGAADEALVMAWQRKVQVYKRDEQARVRAGEIAPAPVVCEPWLPQYLGREAYAGLAHLSSPDSYFEDFQPGTRIEHSRGRTVSDEHTHLTAILDNTSQVHCNQHMIDRDPQQYVGGQRIIYGGIPFVLCLGLSCPDVGDNALADLVYATGSHLAPLFAGDTVFAATDIEGLREHPTRSDLGIVDTTLRGHKFERAEGAPAADAPPGWKRTRIFELRRELVVKRKSHYGP
jgi:2-methylfumaryl-CoA hydratase